MAFNFADRLLTIRSCHRLMCMCVAYVRDQVTSRPGQFVTRLRPRASGAAGQSSTMVCTYAGQVIMGGMVQIKLRPWKQIAMTRALALGPALAVAVSTYGDQRLFNRINEYLNVLQSVLPSPDAAAVLRRCDRRPIDT